MGFGFFQSPNNREMLSNVARERSGNASGVLAIMRTFGQCLGAALLGTVLAIYTAGAVAQGEMRMSAAQDGEAIRLALWIAVLATALATAVSASRLRRKAQSPA